MTVGCLQFNTCNSIIKNFNDMPHDSCIDVIKKAVVLIFSALAMVFAFVYDLACDICNYLCGSNEIEKANAKKESQQEVPNVVTQFTSYESYFDDETTRETRALELVIKKVTPRGTSTFVIAFEGKTVIESIMFGLQRLPTSAQERKICIAELLENPENKAKWALNCLIGDRLISAQEYLKVLFPDFYQLGTSDQRFVIQALITGNHDTEDGKNPAFEVCQCINQLDAMATQAATMLAIQTNLKVLIQKNRNVLENLLH